VGAPAGVGILVGGNGGAGLASTITGASVTYAGGGAGCTGATGGAGGGGNSDVAGTVNTGGGGGYAKAGGSGIAIISYASAAQIGSGGTVTSYTNGLGVTIWVHTFTTSGTYTA
jgi:hypothetical protein